MKHRAAPQWSRSLAACTSGAAAIEAALLVPMFLFMLMGIMESCRLLWITQAANTVAFEAARCQAIGTNCPNAASVKNYVMTVGKSFALQVDGTTVLSATKTTCRTFGGSSKVQFTVRYGSVMSEVLSVYPKTLTVVGCYLQI